LIAELNLEEINFSKLDFDVIGHYSRNDIFQFNVVNQPNMKKEKQLKTKTKHNTSYKSKLKD